MAEDDCTAKMHWAPRLAEVVEAVGPNGHRLRAGSWSKGRALPTKRRWPGPPFLRTWESVSFEHTRGISAEDASKGERVAAVPKNGRYHAPSIRFRIKQGVARFHDL